MKNYVIIGGSSGIGKALAESLATADTSVIATYNTHPTESDAGIQYHHYDALAENPKLSFLPDEIHGIAYCPGAIDLKPFARMKPESFIDDYKLQVMGAVQIIQAALPALKKAGQSGIVLFSTVAVQTGFPFHSKVSASKGALEGLTRALAAELAPTVRVNCIAPSITNTPLASGLLNSPEKMEANANRHPLKVVGEASDIASLAAYLLTSGKWITGQVLSVDGGMSTLKI